MLELHSVQFSVDYMSKCHNFFRITAVYKVSEDNEDVTKHPFGYYLSGVLMMDITNNTIWTHFHLEYQLTVNKLNWFKHQWADQSRQKQSFFYHFYSWLNKTHNELSWVLFSLGVQDSSFARLLIWFSAYTPSSHIMTKTPNLPLYSSRMPCTNHH